MEFNSTAREEMIQWLCDIEQRYPVETWRIDGIYFWNYLRNKLQFELATPPPPRRRTQYFNIYSKIKIKIILLYKKIESAVVTIIKLLCLNSEISSKSDGLFVSHKHFAANFNNLPYDRYLGPLMDYLSTKKTKTFFIQLDIVNYRKFLFQRKFFLFLPYSIFIILCTIFKKSLVEARRYDEFEAELRKKFGLQTFAFYKIKISFNYILSLSKLFEKILKKVQPLYVFELVYYSYIVMALNIAAHRLRIKTFELQHGGMGRLHASYSKCLKFPEDGYETFPRAICVWDEPSFLLINDYLQDNLFHKVYNIGNPWLTKLQTDNSLTKFAPLRPHILHTLQYTELDDYVIEAIRETKDFWILRLHPLLGNLKELKKILIKNNIYNKVYIDFPDTSPLFNVFKTTLVHISKSSGSIIEGAFCAVPTIIIDDVGNLQYKSLIEQGLAVLCLNKEKEKLIEKIKELKGQKNVKLKNNDYRVFLDNLLKNNKYC